MKLRKIAAAFVAFGALSGTALAAPPSWQGTFFVTEASPSCAASDNNVGEFGTILYRPIINPGDPAEGISLYFTRSAETIIANSGGGTFRGFAPYFGFETGRNVYPNQFSGTTNLTIVPAIITTATTTVSITGRINNFFNNTPACYVSISATLLPRI